jgi:tetratricopeptide (TPR) repeat protein
MLIISFAVIKTAKRLPYLFAGWAWYAITILPVIGIMPIGDFAMADRYHYIPSIGIAVMLAWGVPALIKSDALAKKFLFAAGISFLLFLAVLSFRQSGYWKNSMSLASHSLEVTKNNFQAHNSMGIALMKQGKMKEAIEHFNEAIRLSPDNARFYNNRGIVYSRQGRYSNALDDFNKALSLRPYYESAYNNRGILYEALGRHQRAVEDLSKAILLKQDYVEAYLNRARVYAKLGKNQSAIDDYNKAMLLNNNLMPKQ